jgi:hypothetical protein
MFRLSGAPEDFCTDEKVKHYWDNNKVDQRTLCWHCRVPKCSGWLKCAAIAANPPLRDKLALILSARRAAREAAEAASN